MMREFYAFDHHEFDEPPARQALQLLEDPGLRRVWLVQAGDENAGYAVLCFGFSLEYHGRDAFVDEIYIRAQFRAQGLGKRALQMMDSAGKKTILRRPLPA
jgi:predicted acetyltransferase